MRSLLGWYHRQSSTLVSTTTAKFALQIFLHIASQCLLFFMLLETKLHVFGHSREDNQRRDLCICPISHCEGRRHSARSPGRGRVGLLMGYYRRSLLPPESSNLPFLVLHLS